jgi:hypothetical protein
MTRCKGKVLTDDVLTPEAVDPAFSMATGHGVGDLCVRSTEGVSDSDSDAAMTIKADAPIGAASGHGWVTSLTAAATTAPMATSTHFYAEQRRKGVSGGGHRRTSNGGGAHHRQGDRLRWRSAETCAREN